MRQRPLTHDIMNRDVAFVFKVTMERQALGEKIEAYADVPLSILCSFQDRAEESEHTDPNASGDHYAEVFTRARNSVSWHDKLVVRGKSMLVVSVLERFSPETAEFLHTEIRCQYLEKPGSINKAP